MQGMKVILQQLVNMFISAVKSWILPQRSMRIEQPHVVVQTCADFVSSSLASVLSPGVMDGS